MHSKQHKSNLSAKLRNRIEVPKSVISHSFAFEQKRINRSCFVQPKKKSFGQLTEHSKINRITDAPSYDWLATIFAKRARQDAAIITLNQEQQTTNLFSEKNSLMVDKFSETAGGSFSKDTQGFNLLKSDNVSISDVPRVKVIALKFSRHKCRNIEVRYLEEKIVCVEYDVHLINSRGDLGKPTQIMRAFFAIKIPNTDKKILENISALSKDIDYVGDEEIEIIDANIIENKCYLEDLRRVLQRKQHKKGKSDLKFLYEIAAKCRNEQSNTSLDQLSRSDLRGIASLILRCKSSVQGITRKKVLPNDLSSTIMGVLSKSVMAKLLREDG